MKLTLKLEELVIFVACGISLYFLQVQWWWYLLLLLGPDISFIGYLGGNKVGAVTYNIFHHKGIAAALIVLSLFMKIENGEIIRWEIILYTGIVLFGHSSMDRFFGYGLKTFEGFKYTHLGQMGNTKL